MKSNPTYADIAAQVGIERCRGLTLSGHYCHYGDHQKGSLETVNGETIVHWADRVRVERAGVRRFLRLGAIAFFIDEGEARPWARLFRAQALINEWAGTIGMRMPAAATERDRLELKAMLVQVPTDEPLRKEAMDWALAK